MAILIVAMVPTPIKTPNKTTRNGLGVLRSQKRKCAQPSTNRATTAKFPTKICQGVVNRRPRVCTTGRISAGKAHDGSNPVFITEGFFNPESD